MLFSPKERGFKAEGSNRSPDPIVVAVQIWSFSTLPGVVGFHFTS